MPSGSLPEAEEDRDYLADYDDKDDEDSSDIEEYDDPSFALAEPLVRPTVRHLSMSQLHALVYEGQIDLNPPYQRDVVWSDERQSNLIESLLRNFWIPPVVFAASTDDYGVPIRVCVDGKQRVTSIIRFIDGQIPYRDPNGSKWYFTVPPSRKKATRMPDHFKKQFSQKLITCVDYDNISRDMEREIFTRVQMGVVLTNAERLQAVCTPRADWVRDLMSRHAPPDGGLTHSLPKWNTKRGNAFQCVAELAYCCDQLPERSEPTLSKLTPWLTEDTEPRAAIKKRVNNALAALQKIVTTPALNAVVTEISHGIAPVEFVFLGALLFLMDGSTLLSRATAAHRMRTYLRRRHSDMFRRKNVFLTLWAYIDCTLDEMDDTEGGVVRRQTGKRRRSDTDGGGESAPKLRKTSVRFVRD